MVINLDKIDKKIIFELDSNSRIPLTQLAKKVRLKRNSVEYRINRLIKTQVIRKFTTSIRPSVFGYKSYKFYIKLGNLDESTDKNIIKFFQSLPLSCLYQTNGSWDYIVGVFVKNIVELRKIKYEIQLSLKKNLEEMKVSTTLEAYNFRKNYLVENIRDTNPSIWIEGYKEYKLSKKDIELLKIIVDNSRIKLNLLAEKLGLSLMTVIKKIRQLTNDKIIYGFRLGINLDNIGVDFYKCIIKLKNFDENTVQQIKDYSIGHPNITYLVECLGDWDFEIAYELESQKDIQEEIRKLRYKFKDILKEVNLLKIKKEYYLSGFIPKSEWDL